LKTVQKSAKLANVLYDIRGPIMDAARQMEEDGHKIIRLNIGNLAVFGFDAPEEIQQDMARNLPNSAGYSDSKGIFAARKARNPEAGHQGRHAGRYLPGQWRERADRHGDQRAAGRW
jgi:alanine-synthesizing transaminase